MIRLKLIQVSKRGYWNIPAAASDVLITEDNFNGQWGKYANKIFISSYKFGNVAYKQSLFAPIYNDTTCPNTQRSKLFVLPTQSIWSIVILMSILVLFAGMFVSSF